MQNKIHKLRAEALQNHIGMIETEVLYNPDKQIIVCKQNGKMKVGYRGAKAFDLFTKFCRITNAKICIIG